MIIEEFSQDKNRLVKKSETITSSNDSFTQTVLPMSITYIKYDEGKKSDAIKHQDVQSVFATVILFARDTTQGRLHMENTALSELFECGDAVFMDPRQKHWVICAPRNEEREVIIFSI